MKSLPFLSLAFLALLLSSSQLFAQDLVYTPKNPAFGGEVFNYQWMLNSANVQNTIVAIEEDPFNQNSS